jgi:hypothetical protein
MTIDIIYSVSNFYNQSIDNPSGPLGFFLVGLAGIFMILFGFRVTPSVINPFLANMIISIVLSIPGRIRHEVFQSR